MAPLALFAKLANMHCIALHCSDGHPDPKIGPQGHLGPIKSWCLSHKREDVYNEKALRLFVFAIGRIDPSWTNYPALKVISVF